MGNLLALLGVLMLSYSIWIWITAWLKSHG